MFWWEWFIFNQSSGAGPAERLSWKPRQGWGLILWGNWAVNAASPEHVNTGPRRNIQTDNKTFMTWTQIIRRVCLILCFCRVCRSWRSVSGSAGGSWFPSSSPSSSPWRWRCTSPRVKSCHITDGWSSSSSYSGGDAPPSRDSSSVQLHAEDSSSSQTPKLFHTVTEARQQRGAERDVAFSSSSQHQSDDTLWSMVRPVPGSAAPRESLEVKSITTPQNHVFVFHPDFHPFVFAVSFEKVFHHQLLTQSLVTDTPEGLLTVFDHF